MWLRMRGRLAGFCHGVRPVGVLKLHVHVSRGEGAGAGAVEFEIPRQGGAQPQPVDHGRDADGDGLRLGSGRDLLEGVAQVRQHAALVDVLHALEAGGVDHLPPERQPHAAGAPVELLGGQVHVDDGLDALPRKAGGAQARGGGPSQPRRHGAQRRLQQPVLVAEIMGEEAGGNAGPLGDVAQGAGGEPHIGDGLDGRLDQLPAADVLRVPMIDCNVGHRPCSCPAGAIVAHVERPFNLYGAPVGFSPPARASLADEETLRHEN
jgi:hypothetical protein